MAQGPNNPKLVQKGLEAEDRDPSAAARVSNRTVGTQQFKRWSSSGGTSSWWTPPPGRPIKQGELLSHS